MGGVPWDYEGASLGMLWGNLEQLPCLHIVEKKMSQVLSKLLEKAWTIACMAQCEEIGFTASKTPRARPASNPHFADSLWLCTSIA